MAKLTEVEKFVKDHLTYISRDGGYLEFNFEGDNYDQEFATSPLQGIRDAIKQVKRMRSTAPGDVSDE